MGDKKHSSCLLCEIPLPQSGALIFLYLFFLALKFEFAAVLVSFYISYIVIVIVIYISITEISNCRNRRKELKRMKLKEAEQMQEFMKRLDKRN